MKKPKPTTSAEDVPDRSQARPEEIIELVPSLVTIKRILVPVDFSEPSRKAVKYASQFARQFEARLTLIHVIEPVPMPEFSSLPIVAETERILRAVRSRLELLSKEEAIQPSMLEGIQVLQGRAYREIVEAARELKTDLIVIATHGYTGFQHMLLGSTTERVVRHAPCPVLVVRENEREFV